MKAIYYVPVTIVAAIFAFGLVQMWQRIPPGNDFYSPYVGAQRLLSGLSPYGVGGADALAAVWHDPFAQAGIAYPLPLLLLVIPFALLAFPLAAVLWTAIGLAMGYTAAFISYSMSRVNNQPGWYGALALALPFAFWPFFRAVRIGQASLLWFGLVVLLVLAIQRDRRWLVVLCVALLPLKPQTGIIFALYGTWWLWRFYRPGLAASAALGAMLLAISLAVQPRWIGEWFAQVQVYEAFVEPPSLWPFGLAALIAFWRLEKPWWVVAAILQVTLFPFSDVYSSLPILLTWCIFSPPLALIGVSISWLALLFPATNSAAGIGLFTLAPPLIAALWEQRPRRQPALVASPTLNEAGS